MLPYGNGRMLLKMKTRGQNAIAISPDGALVAASTWSTAEEFCPGASVVKCQA